MVFIGFYHNIWFIKIPNVAAHIIRLERKFKDIFPGGLKIKVHPDQNLGNLSIYLKLPWMDILLWRPWVVSLFTHAQVCI
jgi:hypothetical protein